MKVLTVVGTRPNFMKVAPLVEQFKKRSIEHILVHTGQHYDPKMSKLFFDDLHMPKPDINLEIGSGSFGEQVGATIQRLEKVFKEEKPDIVIVVGDVNSTFAAAFTAKQLHLKVAHVEAGLRSFDNSMPEEINRVLTDRISDFLFTTEESANTNLKKEGVDENNIFFVGNVMIDTLLNHQKKAEESTILSQLNLEENEYCAITLHRPSNVDSKTSLTSLLTLFEKLQQKMNLIFPLHPRTRKNMEKFGLLESFKGIPNLTMTEPLGYLDFVKLMTKSKVMLTDSGGIQEETTVLGVPCITFRNNTERPITVEKGTNLLVSTNPEKVEEAFNSLKESKERASIPPLWDGKAAERIIDVLLKTK